MSSFQVLDAAIPEERTHWVAVWGSWPAREVMAHPDYVQLFARVCDQSCCAIMDNGTGKIMFPFILRPLPVEPWGGKSDSYDLISPYGYGGPFALGTTDALAFWKEFDEWAKRVGVVSTFTRLSLFPEQVIPFAGDIEIRGPNIVRTLDLDSRAMWMDYKHKVRKNVKRAQGASLRVEVDLVGARLDDFIAIYQSTMERRNAEDYYYFTEDFFLSALSNLQGQLAFFHALYEGKVVSTELVLISADNIYSFLGGTLAEAFALRPNDLIKHTIIEWGRERGKKAFVLGGGYNGCDGIFLYKKSFAPNGEVPFKIGKRIYDLEIYEELVLMRRAWEAVNGRSWDPRSDFFPSYRADFCEHSSSNRSLCISR
ncbi:MAG: GNAT family N-acetyltransferase [Actinobacteria bacterium]|nr:GNAT family N-acetyltransferase [Actinomycetota bacterium]